MFEHLRIAASRVRACLMLRRVDADFEQELATHLALLTEENIRRGMPLDLASRQARLQLGGAAQLRETNPRSSESVSGWPARTRSPV